MREFKLLVIGKYDTGLYFSICETNINWDDHALLSIGYFPNEDRKFDIEVLWKWRWSF